MFHRWWSITVTSRLYSKAPISLGRRSWRPWRSVKILQSVAESRSISNFGLRGDYSTLSLRSNYAEGDSATLMVRCCHAHADFSARRDALLLRSSRSYYDISTLIKTSLQRRYVWSDSDTLMPRSCYDSSRSGNKLGHIIDWVPIIY